MCNQAITNYRIRRIGGFLFSSGSTYPIDIYNEITMAKENGFRTNIIVNDNIIMTKHSHNSHRT